MKKVMPTKKSWSELCREHVELCIWLVENNKNVTIDWVILNLKNSHRPPIFRYRCAKLLRRAIKSGRVK